MEIELDVLDSIETAIKMMNHVHRAAAVYTLQDKEYRKILELYHILGKIRLLYLGGWRYMAGKEKNDNQKG